MIALVNHTTQTIIKEFTSIEEAIKVGTKSVIDLLQKKENAEGQEGVTEKAEDIFLLDAENITKEEEETLRRAPLLIRKLVREDHLQEKWLHYYSIIKLLS